MLEKAILSEWQAPRRVTYCVKEIGEVLGVSPTTIYTMVREGQIPFVRVRSRILFHQDIIESWLRGEFAVEKQA